MTKINIKSLENALISLQKSIIVSKQYLADKNASIDLKETLQAGVIQHFEFSYELSFTILKRQLEQEAVIPAAIDSMSFQELIREGAEKGYIQDPKKWLVYRHQRNLTSHTYRADYAKSVYESAVNFYQDAHALFLKLQEKNK